MIAGIAGAGDLRLGAHTTEMLEAGVAAADGKFRGIRQRATWDADPSIRPSTPYAGEGLLLDPWFLAAIPLVVLLACGVRAVAAVPLR